MCLCLVILNQSKVEIFGCCDEGFCYWMKLTFRHSHPEGYAVSAGQRYVIVIKVLNMADNSVQKGPWKDTLDSFVKYVALNPKEFLFYGK